MSQLSEPSALAVPNAILFDLDNTLYAYDPAHQAAMRAVEEKVERVFQIDIPRFTAMFDSAKAEIKARLGANASSHSRLLYFQRTFELMGLRSQLLHALDFEQTYWRTFLSGARLYPELREFLDDIRLAGIPTAVVTDLTAQIQFRKLVYFGLDHAFDYVVTAEEAGAEKPTEPPFRLAMAKLSLADARVWFIGDHPNNDIAGAKQVLAAVTLQRVDRGAARPPVGAADVVFTDYHELRGLLSRVLSRRTSS